MGKPLPQYAVIRQGMNDSLQQKMTESNEEFCQQQRRKWNPTDDRATQAENIVTNAGIRESENTAAR